MGVAFLVVETVLLIDFSYRWSEDWVEKFEKSGNSRFWPFWLFLFTGGWTLGIVIYFILDLVHFNCTGGLVLSVTVLIASISMIILASSTWIEHGCNS